MMALRLAAVCLGSGGIGKCVCSVFRVLEPEWLKLTTDKKKRCEEDPMDLIMGTILGTAATMVEGPLNGFIDMLNKVIGWMGKVDHMCFTLPSHMEQRKCNFEADGNGALHQAFLKCEDNSKGLEYMCYYKRKEDICLSSEKKTAYQALFDIGEQTTDELTSAYAEQFGSTYTTLTPAMSQLFENVGTTNENRDFTALRNICQDVGPGSMGLDQVITACIFAMANGMCKNSASDELVTFLSDVQWKLPDIRWDYGKKRVSNPPQSARCHPPTQRLQPPTQRLQPTNTMPATANTAPAPHQYNACNRQHSACTPPTQCLQPPTRRLHPANTAPAH